MVVHGAGGMGKTTAVVAYPAEGSPTAFDAVLFVAVGQTRQVRDFSGLPRLYRGQILVLWIYVIPTVNPKDSSRWIVCRSIPFFVTRRCGVFWTVRAFPIFIFLYCNGSVSVSFVLLPVGRAARAPGPTFISTIVLVSHFCPLSGG